MIPSPPLAQGGISAVPRTDVTLPLRAHQEWTQKQAKANAFIEPALGAYFANEGIDPFQEAAI